MTQRPALGAKIAINGNAEKRKHFYRTKNAEGYPSDDEIAADGGFNPGPPRYPEPACTWSWTVWLHKRFPVIQEGIYIGYRKRNTALYGTQRRVPHELWLVVTTVTKNPFLVFPDQVMEIE